MTIRSRSTGSVASGGSSSASSGSAASRSRSSRSTTSATPRRIVPPAQVRQHARPLRRRRAARRARRSSSTGARSRCSRRRTRRSSRGRPWAIDLVVEGTGVFTSREQCTAHLTAGARKVLLTAPPKDDLDAMIVLGVNDDDAEARAPARLERLVHDELPRARREGPPRGLRHRARLHEHDPRLHERPARARPPAQGPAPRARGGREHHPDHDRRREGGRQGASRRSRASSTGISLRVPVPDGSIVRPDGRSSRSPRRSRRSTRAMKAPPRAR